MAGRSRKGTGQGPMIRIPPGLIEAVEQARSSMSWGLLSEYVCLPRSTFHGEWKPRGEGKALQVLNVCVGLYRLQRLLPLDEVGFSDEEIARLRALWLAGGSGCTPEEGDRLFDEMVGDAPGRGLGPDAGGGRGGLLAAEPSPGEAPGVSKSATREVPASGRMTLSRRTPVVRGEMTLFDRRKMDDAYYAPIERGLAGEFGWPSHRVVAARFVLGELINNAFEHGCRGAGELVVSFSAEAEGDGSALTVRVASPGPGFDFARVLREGLERGIEGDGETLRGRGLLSVSRLAADLVARSDGRVIQATIVRDPGALGPLRLQATVLSCDGGDLAVVPFPRDARREELPELDREQIRRTIAAHRVRGGIIDMTLVDPLLFNSPTLDVIMGVARVFAAEGRLPLAVVACRDIIETFRIVRLFEPGRHGPGRFETLEAAIEGLLGR